VHLEPAPVAQDLVEPLGLGAVVVAVQVLALAVGFDRPVELAAVLEDVGQAVARLLALVGLRGGGDGLIGLDRVELVGQGEPLDALASRAMVSSSLSVSRA